MKGLWRDRHNIPGRWSILPGGGGAGGGFPLVHDSHRREPFTPDAEQIRDFFRNFDSSLVRPAGEGIGVELRENVGKRQVDEPAFLGGVVGKQSRRPVTAQLGKADLHGTLRKLFEHLAAGEDEFRRACASRSKFPPEILGNTADD